MEQEAATCHWPKRLGPPHLRIVEIDFLKPTLRNESERSVEPAPGSLGGPAVNCQACEGTTALLRSPEPWPRL